MKKTILAIILCATLFSCKGEENVDYVVFSGSIKNTKATSFRVSCYDYSLKQEIAIDKSGNFRDTVYISDDGFYSFQIGRSYTSLFFRKGDDINISLDANDFFKTLKVTGNTAVLNTYHLERRRLKSKLVGDAKEFFVVPLDDFLNKLNANQEAYLAHLEEAKISEEDKIISKSIIEYDYILTKFNYDKFNHYHLKKHPVLPEGYNDALINMNMDDENAFHYDKSYRILVIENWRQTSAAAEKTDPNYTPISFVKNKISTIKSDKIKQSIISMLFRQVNSKNENFESDYQEILKLVTDDSKLASLNKRYNSAKSTQPNMEVMDFNYENFEGGKTSLSDLKGKILYVEIWATWCGPCVKEMPALTELIKEYKGKNIEFVSISVDSKTDYEKWKKMVPEKNVGGVQLIADKQLKSDFMKFFSVGLIPRSILIDENGKIITNKAPRPSSPDTRPYLDKLLNKK